VYVDSSNRIYVADTNNHRVQQWMPNAVSGTTVAGQTGISGSNGSLLYYPITIYVDAQFNLYIGDEYGINKWALGASVGSRVSGSSGIGTVSGIFVDTNGHIYASTNWPCVVRMWTSTATASTIVAGNSNCGSSPSELYYPYGISIDSSTGTIFIGNSNANTIVS
jgi:sugar lactone lactonase YvrE